MDTPAALNAMKTFLENLGITTVLGVPESFTGPVSAYVADGARDMRDRATGNFIEQNQRIFVALGYRVAGAETDIELALATMVDSIVSQWYQDRRNGQGFFAIAQNATLDMSIQNDPRYQIIAGQEFRIYPFLVIYSQREVIS